MGVRNFSYNRVITITSIIGSCSSIHADFDTERAICMSVCVDTCRKHQNDSTELAESSLPFIPMVFSENKLVFLLCERLHDRQFISQQYAEDLEGPQARSSEEAAIGDGCDGDLEAETERNLVNFSRSTDPTV